MNAVLTLCCCAALALLGLLLAGRTTFHPPRLRRAGIGLCLLVAAGLGCWLTQGGTVPWPRAVVVAFADDAADPKQDEARAKDLEAVLTGLSPWDRVGFLRLVGTADAPAAHGDWTNAADAAPRPGEAAADYLARVRGRAATASLDPARAWAGDLIGAGEALLAPEAGLLGRRPSLLVVHDKSPLWDGLGVTNFDADALLAGPKDNESLHPDLFLFEAPSGSPAGRLEISMGRDVLSKLPSIKEYGPAEIVVSLLDCPYRKKGARYQLEAWIDGPMAGPDPPPHFHRAQDATDPGPDIPEVADPPLKLRDFAAVPDDPKGELLDRGLHRLQVSLTLESERNGVKIPATYTAVRYILVEPRNVVVMQTPKPGAAALSGWAAHDWAALAHDKVPASGADLFRRYLRDKAEKGLGKLRWREDLWESNVVALPLPSGDAVSPADAKALRDALAQSRALVLVEPTLQQLALLDTALKEKRDKDKADDEDLNTRVRNGLAVLVVGPPPLPAGGPKWPEWLPCGARPAEPPPAAGPAQPEALRVHRDRRLFFCTDCCRLMAVSTPADQTRETTGAYTPLQAQADVVNGLCSRLGAPALLSLAQDGVNRRLAVAGPAQPRGGRLPDGTPVAVETPLVQYAPLKDKTDIEDRYIEFLGPIRETAPSYLPWRLQPILDPNPDPNVLGEAFRPVELPHLYPGATAVLFLADLPQYATMPDRVKLPGGQKYDLGLRAAASGDGVSYSVWSPDDWSAHYVPRTRDVLTRLAQAGVHLAVVHVKFRPTANDWLTAKIREDERLTPADYLDKLRTEPALKPFLTEYTLDFTQNLAVVRRQAQEVAAGLHADLVKRAPAEMVRQRSGRVIDERVADRRPAPLTHLVLQAPPGGEAGDLYEPPHAVIRGAALADEALKDGVTPAVVARVEGEGEVVVLGYSPFAPDLWRTDEGPSDWLVDPAPAPDRVDGWGVQRLIDLTQLTAHRALRPHHPVVQTVREAPDGATLFIDCWADLPAGGDWMTPEVTTAEEGGKKVGDCVVIDADPVSRRVVYQFQLGRDWKGDARGKFWLHFTGADSGDNPSLHLNLKKAGGAGRNVKEALSQLAYRTGGAAITAETARAELAYRLPTSWFVGLSLCLAALLVLVPPLRPWTAVVLPAMEWLRAANPCLPLAYLLTPHMVADNLWFAQWVEPLGFFGLAVVLCGFSLTAARVLALWADRGARRTAVVGMAVWVGALAGAHLLGAWRLASVRAEPTTPFRAAVVQEYRPRPRGGADAPAFGDRKAELTARVRRVLARGPCDALFLPESALYQPLTPGESDALTPRELGRLLEESGAPVAVAGVTIDRPAPPETYRNSVGIVTSAGLVAAVDKRLPAPVGEAVPLAGLPLLQSFGAFVAETDGGQRCDEPGALLDLPDGRRLSAAVCYEHLFPDVWARRGLGDGETVDLQMVCANLSWFDYSDIERRQSRAARRLLAVERRTPLLYAADGGSEWVGADGGLREALSAQDEGAIWDLELPSSTAPGRRPLTGARPWLLTALAGAPGAAWLLIHEPDGAVWFCGGKFPTCRRTTASWKLAATTTGQRH